MCFGCPVGEDRYVMFKLGEIADQILEDARKTAEVLKGDRQALWAGLRASMNQRFDFWCQLVRPNLVQPVAARLDKGLWKIFEAAAGFPIPSSGQPLGADDCLLNVPVQGLEARPFAEWVARLPIKLHGAGLRSFEDICQAAYLGALEQAAPYMAKQLVLEDVLGGEAAWGEGADLGSRWSPLLASGHKDGASMRQSWLNLKQEATEAALYLGEELSGVMAEQVTGAGRDCLGKLRQALVEQRETTRGRVLLQALEQHPNRGARPVWSWKQRDKHSAAFLLCLPGPSTSLSAAEFSEAFAALLCLPSPACSSRVGEAIPGRARESVCKYGDAVMNAIMRGDGCRKRHDAMKMKLLNLLTWAGIPVNCEVFNLFADAIPQAGLSRIEQGRRRQGLVPDFKLRGEEGDESILCELKFISASKTRYPRNPQRRDGKRAVDVRAEGLTAEYAKKAQNIDHDFGGVPRPSPVQRGAPQPPRVIGRVEARLQSFGKVHGWCFGSWGEASEDVHPLVQLIAKSMLLIGEMRPGRRGPPKSDVAQLAALVSYVRRQLSITAVREQARMLLERMQLLGDGSADAGRRRERAAAEEAKAHRERQAQLVCLRQGQAIIRHGFGKLN